jgi:16S rRNA (uracil1498-N3)-methyltransferase
LRVDEAAETEQVQRLVGEADTALLLDERATHPIGEVDPVGAGRVVLVVGPEGGLSDLEREVLASAGALPVRMGPTIMRTSTAGAVAAAVLLAAGHRWRETP